ncbi:MAG: hypothetical protein Kilf2KO_15110 [Rhodospirillales bacterium]
MQRQLDCEERPRSLHPVQPGADDLPGRQELRDRPAYDADGIEVDTDGWLATDDRRVCTTIDSEAQTCFDMRSDGTVVEMEADGQAQRGVLFEGNARRPKKGS